jgi:hypothetical protein
MCARAQKTMSAGIKEERVIKRKRRKTRRQSGANFPVPIFATQPFLFISKTKATITLLHRTFPGNLTGTGFSFMELTAQAVLYDQRMTVKSSDLSNHLVT